MTGASIELDDVAHRFATTVALDQITWSGAGGVVGVLGPNGAGKTTVARIVATVLEADRGRVRIDGLDPARPGDRLTIRRRLGYLPQRDALYRGFTAFELVDYVATLKELTDRHRRHGEVRRVLELVGLDDQRHRRIRTMSGGMQRRVSLATALLGDPRLLVLDEPGNGLDPDQRLRLREVLSQIGRQATVLLSTHQTAEVEVLCRQVLVLDHGRVIFDGTPAALAAVATDRVWLDERAHPGALRSWTTADQQVRCIGEPPIGAQLVAPGIDDGYLLLTAGASR